jgi:putative DNA primase/helicase
MMDVEFDPESSCPTYDAFIDKVQPSSQVRRFLHQWAGLSLTGDISEQKLTFFWGKGRNGKTTLIEAWARIFADYACSIPIESLMDNGRPRSGGQATPDLAILPSIRFVHTDEPSRNAKLSESLVKLLTGGDTIQARELNKGFFSFKPEFKLTMCGNYRPIVDGGEASQGTWRRLILVRWPITIPEQEIDRHLSEKLRRESSGILNRLLDGLRDWIDHGLQIPDEVKETTEDYRRDSDLLGRFLDECAERDADGRVSNGELYVLFRAYAKFNGDQVWHQKGLTKAMQERGFVQGRNNERFWPGIRLLKSASDFEVSSRDEPDQHYEDDIQI